MKHLLRIALLSETYPPDVGGLAVSAQRLAELLAAVGHDIHVIVCTDTLPAGQVRRVDGGKASVNGDVGSDIKSDDRNDKNSTIHRIGAANRIDDTLAHWFDYVVAHPPAPFDLIHGYFVPKAGFVAAYAAHYLGIPSVVSARGNDIDRAVFEPRKASHIFYALQHATALTANTHDLIRKIRALVPSRDAVYIPNSVDIDLFSPPPPNIPYTPLPDAFALREQLVASHPALATLPLIGFVGEARAKKGLSTLLIAVRQVAEQRPIGLLIVGGVRRGDDKDMLKLFQKQHPHIPIVVIPPVPLHEMPHYYHLFDMLVMPSLHDGLPNAVLEAMACGCAIIGTPVGGMVDVLQDGVNACLVPPGDASSLATAIHDLLNQPAHRRSLGECARKTVEQHFTPRRELEATLALYERVRAEWAERPERPERA